MPLAVERGAKLYPEAVAERLACAGNLRVSPEFGEHLLRDLGRKPPLVMLPPGRPRALEFLKQIEAQAVYIVIKVDPRSGVQSAGRLELLCPQEGLIRVRQLIGQEHVRCCLYPSVKNLDLLYPPRVDSI